MISRIRGTLVSNDLDQLEIETASGLTYAVTVPLTVLQQVPPVGSTITLRTVHVVREDSATLYGFVEEPERILFTRLMGTSGVGAKLALSMMSTYAAHRLAQALVERDVAALTQIPLIGKKKAERLVLELADKVQDLALAGAATASGEIAAPRIVQDAVAALVALGFTFVDADVAVRAALKVGEPETADELIRAALGQRAG